MKEAFHIGKIAIGGRVLTAPMSGVSDLPFRRAASRLGAPYVVTEMVACETLVRGRPDVVRRAAVGQGLPLMVVQLVGREADWIAKGAALAEASGAEIIDLNMGCPSREVTGGLSGSALMRDLDHAERLLDAAVGATSCPVTLKMRLGWDETTKNAPELAVRAERAGIRAITVHGRTRRQFFNGTSDWQAVAEVKRATGLPVIVNGDVVDAETARQALEKSSADAVMIGRAACGKPWIAGAIARALQDGGAMREPKFAERLHIVLDHFRDCLAFYGDGLGLKMFRKHLARYIEDAPSPASAADRRIAKSRLCTLGNPREVETGLIALWAKQSEGICDEQGRSDGLGARQRLADDRRQSQPYEAVCA